MQYVCRGIMFEVFWLYELTLISPFLHALDMYSERDHVLHSRSYLMHFLDNAQKLIDRSREAIYEEYGYPVSGISEERDKSFGFRKGETYDDLRKLGVPIVATKTEFDGLVRRLLHAMMTNQEFKVALNGHSVAAGHDSNFWQSYIHQFHHVSRVQ